MSGPTPSEQLYETAYSDIDWTSRKVADLRSLAEYVEQGHLIGSDELPNQHIASLLRAKADKIEAALRTIDNETHDDWNELIKAIQYNQTGDYGAEQVQEAWDNYGEQE